MELGEIILHYPDYYQNGSNVNAIGVRRYDLYYQLYYNVGHPVQDGGERGCCATFTMRMQTLFMLIEVGDCPTTCCSECYLCFVLTITALNATVRIGCDSKCSGLDPYQHVSSNLPRVRRLAPIILPRAALLYHPPGHVSWSYSTQCLLTVFLPKTSTNVFIDNQPSMVAYGNLGIPDKNAMHGSYMLESRHGHVDVGFFATCSASVDIGFSVTIAELSDMSSCVTTCLPTMIEGSFSSVGEFCMMSSHLTVCLPRIDNEGSSTSIGAVCCLRINESCFTKTVGEVGSLVRLLQSMSAFSLSLPCVRHHVLLFLAIPNLHKVLLSYLGTCFFCRILFFHFPQLIITLISSKQALLSVADDSSIFNSLLSLSISSLISFT
ncbi:hypothetical protein M9H77_31417 [Catharanthus roseus]|uniref:Uncharacterized protein n=1 Tax=Catharanthus roseus TaxID=4058 RepID=A0ACC0A1V7_CATRO|nr:hypothetical protein M9H77_31417 [Catharanthus roseus]